mmetsp:Transcript_12795/g.25543  ORF Transcript_12795/g.25543 Transcript_12795/m.25543 type:complete len:220 (-) Transcript_12795:1110-1769(-)
MVTVTPNVDVPPPAPRHTARTEEHRPPVLPWSTDVPVPPDPPVAAEKNSSRAAGMTVTPPPEDLPTVIPPRACPCTTNRCPTLRSRTTPHSHTTPHSLRLATVTTPRRTRMGVITPPLTGHRLRRRHSTTHTRPGDLPPDRQGHRRELFSGTRGTAAATDDPEPPEAAEAGDPTAPARVPPRTRAAAAVGVRTCPPRARAVGRDSAAVARRGTPRWDHR